MKFYLLLFNSFLLFTVISPQIAWCKVIGVVKKEALLRQIQISLEVPIESLQIPQDLIAKLPVKNDLTEITPVFINAWTQVSFLACFNFFNQQTWSTSEKLNITTKNWLSHLSNRTHGVRLSESEISTLMDSMIKHYPEYADNQNNFEIIDQPEFHLQLAKACSLIFTNPKVYLQTL